MLIVINCVELLLSLANRLSEKHLGFRLIAECCIFHVTVDFIIKRNLNAFCQDIWLKDQYTRGIEFNVDIILKGTKGIWYYE